MAVYVGGDFYGQATSHFDTRHRPDEHDARRDQGDAGALQRGGDVGGVQLLADAGHDDDGQGESDPAEEAVDQCEDEIARQLGLLGDDQTGEQDQAEYITNGVFVVKTWVC